MQRKHSDILEELGKEKELEKKKTIKQFYSSVGSKKLGKISKPDQIKGVVLLARWLCGSLKSFRTVEDEGLRNFTSFINHLNTEFEHVSRNLHALDPDFYPINLTLDLEPIH